MILPVLLYNQKILNTPCKPVTDFNNSELEQLVQDMIETMDGYNGVGLAAPQVNKGIQMCVLNAENKTKKMVVINPKIISYSKQKIKLAEGCLSAPGISIEIKRPESIIVDANLLSGELIRYQFNGYDARIFAHEYFHLQGQTIVRGLQSMSILL